MAGLPRLHERLAPAVTPLLAQVRDDAASSVVPYESRRMESDLSASIEQSPAQVDVVPGSGEDGVEPSQLQQRLPPEAHVAPGNVLGSVVGHEHVHGAGKD